MWDGAAPPPRPALAPPHCVRTIRGRPPCNALLLRPGYCHLGVRGATSVRGGYFRRIPRTSRNWPIPLTLDRLAIPHHSMGWPSHAKKQPVCACSMLSITPRS